MMRRTDGYPDASEAPATDDPTVYRDGAPVVAERPVVEERTTAPAERRVVVESTSEFGGIFVARLLLTLAGAAAMIVGAFGSWNQTLAGTELTDRSLVQTTFTTSTFLLSVGAIAIALGLVAVIGLAFRSGWLTRLAGALGIAMFVLYTIELFRVPGPFATGSIGWGAWTFLAGSVVALIGGFLTKRAPEVVHTDA
ncbi:MAG: hypothetical protein ACJ76P_14665 [Actinomycetota bacterium]